MDISEQLKGTLFGIILASVLDAAGLQDEIERRVENAAHQVEKQMEDDDGLAEM